MAKTNFATSSRSLLVFLVVFFQLYSGVFSRPKGPTTTPKHGNGTDSSHAGHKGHQIKVAKFDFEYIAAPFIVASWVLLASLLKLGFHMTTTLSKFVPESCMVILLGVVLGGLSDVSGYKAPIPFFSSRIFFLFLLPPIVLEAGYFLHTRAFFDNIGTILLFAVVGTLFNTFTVGLTLWATTDLHINLLQMLLFSSLIAAVDPVAVLAVFEEVHINETLYILVFGESLLNDAVTVVLYRLFEALVSQETIAVEEVFTGVAAFFVVSIGGLLIGIFWAVLTAFLTKFTDHVRVLEPIFVVCMSYMAYLTAELFHFSGIISIVTSAILMRPYVEANISQKSRIPVKYFLKMASSLSETIIFMFLGVILFERDLVFNAKFVFLTIFFITLYRCLGVVLLSWLANTIGRLNKLGKVDQFVMAYGGLRGAVAFSLATLIDKKYVQEQTIMETTAIAVVFFTVFVQGTTIKPIVGLLKVKRAVKRKEIMLGEVNDKMLDHLLGGVQDVIQHRGHYYWKNLYQYVDGRYLRRWLMRHQSDCNAVDETLLMVYRKLCRREAMDAVENLQASQSDSDKSDDFDHVVKDRRQSSGLAPSATGESRDEQRHKDMYGHVQLAFLLEKPRKGTIRRFSRNNILDETDIGDQALRIRRRSQTQVPRMISRKVSREEASGGQAETSGQRKPRRKHEHAHAHCRRRTHGSKKPQKVRKQLSDIAESPKSESPPESLGQASPPVDKNDEEAEMSSASDAPSEERDLLPKLADLEPSTPTLDTHFIDIGGPLVAVDTHVHGSPDGISETVM